MKRTFYSVDCTCIGTNGVTTKWFNNLEDAKEFAAHDYRDNPTRHTFKNANKINEIEKVIEMQG